MRSQSVALILVGLMLFAPALGFTEKTQLEAEFEPQNAARSTAMLCFGVPTLQVPVVPIQ